MAVLYLCDGKACEVCSPECNHTSDISHAVNFKKEPGENYWERAIFDPDPEIGVRISDIIMDESSALVNSHGRYAAKFASNHGVSIEKALEHPMVKAHLSYLTSVKGGNNRI